MKPKEEYLKFAVLAVDAVCFSIIDGKLSVLLGKVVTNPFYKNKWAHIGGLIRPDETADLSIDRLLKDKAGIKNIFKEQLYTFSDIKRDARGRVVSVAYLSLIPSEYAHSGQGSVETKWIPVADIPSLAYDHNQITKVAVERLQSKIEYTNIAQHLLPEEFTLTQLQQVYEIILGSKLDKRNFRKKILGTGMLKDTKRTQKKGVMRPAALYTFASKKQKVVEIL
jgi:8-oxo-dGTP diphosphatase